MKIAAFITIMKKIFKIILLLLFSCNVDSIKDESKSPKSLSYKFEKDYAIGIDDETNIFNYLSAPINLGNEQKLSFFSEISNSLNIYDISNGTLEKKVKYPIQGPNSIFGIGFNSGLIFVNIDSIIYYSRLMERIYISNSNGDIYKSLNLTNTKNSFGSIDISSPMVYLDKSIYLQTLPKIPIYSTSDSILVLNRISKINLETAVVTEHEIESPAIYSSGNFSYQLKMLDFVYNPTIDKFIFSYPLSDSLYVVDFKGYSKSYVAKSDLVNNFIESDPQNKIVPKSKLTNYYFWRSDSYGKLIYDPINDIYLREARKGITEQNFLDRKLKTEKEILILNNKFEHIGTIPHNGGDFFYYFFGKNRIFWNKDLVEFNLNSRQEDSLFFDVVLIEFK
ncbi:hypothetical protein [Algoriphagus sp.]|uniref:hypothetical protein n=1 Tax=Algoriphagus sp. TaxID=1872435 RepID=UPI00391B73C1